MSNATTAAPEISVAGPCGGRPFQAQPLVVKFLDQDPTCAGLLLKSVTEAIWIPDHVRGGAQDLELPAFGQVGVAVPGHGLFLLTPTAGTGSSRGRSSAHETLLEAAFGAFITGILRSLSRRRKRSSRERRQSAGGSTPKFHADGVFATMAYGFRSWRRRCPGDGQWRTPRGRMGVSSCLR